MCLKILLGVFLFWILIFTINVITFFSHRILVVGFFSLLNILANRVSDRGAAHWDKAHCDHQLRYVFLWTLMRPSWWASINSASGLQKAKNSLFQRIFVFFRSLPHWLRGWTRGATRYFTHTEPNLARIWTKGNYPFNDKLKRGLHMNSMFIFSFFSTRAIIL